MRRLISFRDFDWVLLAFVLLLSVISVLEIYSATLHTKFIHFDEKQAFWLLGGLTCMFFLSLVDYHLLLDIAHWAYGFCIVALIAVRLVGQSVLGARRWIDIGAVNAGIGHDEAEAVLDDEHIGTAPHHAA